MMAEFTLWVLFCSFLTVVSTIENISTVATQPEPVTTVPVTTVSPTTKSTITKPKVEVNKNGEPLPTCSLEQLKYVYTECDVNKGRWKVQVPRQPNTCKLASPPSPERGKHCSFSCPEGHYLDINTQTCQQCRPGTYSLSDGVRFRSWDKLPAGFDTWGRDADDNIDTPIDSEFNKCRGKNWTTKGQYIESAGEFCKSILVYSVTLEKPGKLYVIYRGDDDMAFFHIKVVNNYCSTAKDGKHHFYLDVAQNWKRSIMNLTEGRNVIFLEAAYFYDDSQSSPPSPGDDDGPTEDGSSEDKPDYDEYTSSSDRSVQIREIKITGLSYSSECTPCEAGTYSAVGSSRCDECEANTFSKPEQAVCTKCKPGEYSGSGASVCKLRPLCAEKDYYETWTPCDKKDMTKKIYTWVRPQICIGGVGLPHATGETKCPPCNPGQFKNGTQCSFCPVGQYSNGNSACQQCPPSTSPDPGLYFMWWQKIPKNVFSFFCFSRTERGCITKNGFESQNTYLDSGIGHADDADIGISIFVPGFTKFNSKLVIEFELECQSRCRLLLQNRIDTDSSPRVIGTWRGQTMKTKFTHFIMSSDSRNFRLSFQKPNVPGKVTYKHTTDRLKIYVLNITNAINGGADRCLTCPLGVAQKGCVKCTVGKYLDVEQKKCLECPENHYLNTSNPIGIKSCMKCGPGTISAPGSTTCHSDCHFHSSEGRHYDFSGLNGSFTLLGGKLFTSHSFPYYHYFNISFCDKVPHAVSCYNNVTHQDYKNDNKAKVSSISASICRTTVIPSEGGGKIFAQSMSLGDFMISVTKGDPFAITEEKNVVNNSATHVRRRRIRRDIQGNRADLVNDTLSSDVNFLFGSHTTTSRCSDGFSTLVTVRCDSTAKGRGFIRMPKKCPQGTCYGCLFHFFWHSERACPYCTTADYMNITSACKDGKVATRHVWNFPRMCRDGVKLPSTHMRACSIFEKSLLDLKVVLLVFFGFALFLAVSVLVLCIRNRKLTYKYHRLVDDAHVKDGELPAVETCTLEEGEDDEEIIISRGPSGGKRILDRLKRKLANTKRRGNFDEFETINLKEYNQHVDDDDMSN